MASLVHPKFVCLLYCLLSSSHVYFRTYEALVGVVTHDFFDELSEAEVRDGLQPERRDRILQTFVRNQYDAHLKEILLTLQN